MRGTIDCAVLMVPGHERWMQGFIEKWASTPSRIALHCVELLDASPVLRPGASLPDGNVLQQRALSLKRYDACLLPVTLDTLGWTRMALAAARGTLQTPLLGVVRDMSAAGLQDLLSLGLADFMRHPLCAEEFKTRLMQLSSSSGHDKAEPAAPPDPDPFDIHGLVLQEPVDREPFRTAKARIVTEFERHYIADLLTRHRGNISQAARAARKNRRAFWQLMRKHEITAESYRTRKTKPDPCLDDAFRPGSIQRPSPENRQRP